MKILIAEDNVSNKNLLQKILKRNGYEVITASNGLEAYGLVVTEKPDMLLTDWMMPKINGLDLIIKIKEEIADPPLIIMITAITSNDACDKVLKAGADVFFPKPQNNQLLISTIKELFTRKKDPLQLSPSKNNITKIKTNLKGIAFAASTGGPPTLSKIFTELQPMANASIFIVLHGPVWMLESFAEKLDMHSPLDIFLADDNVKISAGAVYLAPGERHMIVDPKTYTLKLLDTEPVNFVKPSADPLFESVAEAYGKNSIGIVLTGMGRDGTIGSGFIKAAGGYIIAQDPDTAILHAMPKSVIDMCLANKILSEDKVADEIMKLVKK